MDSLQVTGCQVPHLSVIAVLRALKALAEQVLNCAPDCFGGATLDSYGGLLALPFYRLGMSL